MTIRKQFDESEIFWHLLFLLADGKFFFKLLSICIRFLFLEGKCVLISSTDIILMSKFEPATVEKKS